MFESTVWSSTHWPDTHLLWYLLWLTGCTGILWGWTGILSTVAWYWPLTPIWIFPVFRRTPRAWRTGTGVISPIGVRIGDSPRGPDHPGILEISRADSLSSRSSLADIHPSRHRTHLHSLQVADLITQGIQEQVRAPGLQVRGQIGVLVRRGRLGLSVLIVADIIRESATEPPVHVFLVAVRAIL